MALTRPRTLAAGGALALALAACGGGDAPTPAAGPDAPTAAPTTAPDATPDAAASPAPPPAAEVDAVDAGSPQVLVTGLQVPWGLTFLPDGDALLTERDTGLLLRVPAAGGDPQELTRFDDVDDTGEGGLLGLALGPDDGLVYAYYTGPTDNRVVRFDVDAPQDREPVVTGIPKGRTHNGGRLAFSPAGDLFVGTGDAGQAELAQDPRSLAGKVLRVPSNGGTVGGEAEVFASGHRNVQGLSFDDDGRLWSVEFGPDRDDEVNLVTEGSNGGWPEVTGVDDGGGRFDVPLVVWQPQEASPSGSAIVGDSLWVAALRGSRLWEVPLDGAGGVGEPQAFLQGDFGRLRTVEQAPDGSLWVLTSNRDGRGSPTGEDDRVLRLPPA